MGRGSAASSLRPAGAYSVLRWALEGANGLAQAAQTSQTREWPSADHASSRQKGEARQLPAVQLNRRCLLTQ